MSILKLNGVNKSYIEFPGFRHRLQSWFGYKSEGLTEHVILDDISLTIERGEAVAFVGQNGAGKSTLLKLIAGVLSASKGSIEVAGKVSAILELGMGFNPDFTGEENARNTLIFMGYPPLEVEKIMPTIKEFTEIADYFEKPIRICSSGMQMRVAFAVATAFQPEILIIDEALSVGDAYFQHKSFERIRQLQKLGTTLIIVSHDKSAIKSLCGRAILLENGRLVKDSNPEEVFDFYNAIIAQKESSTIRIKEHNGKKQTSSGTGEVTIQSAGLYDARDREVESVSVGETVELRIAIKAHEATESLVMGYSIKERWGQVCYGTNTWYSEQVLTQLKPGDEYQYTVSFDVNLGVGSYSISVALHDQETHLARNYDWRDLMIIFNVRNDDKPTFQGFSWLPQSISVQQTK
ncbi:MAG TPA: ABC transporter ATP-binding protein [Gammaproteobacteria bacterium]|jgi:lipopolysaccharide transport system ATP-binding protein|nr:ABC transporter ATP-binding protein [Gammaproteobacteria bacterium]